MQVNSHRPRISKDLWRAAQIAGGKLDLGAGDYIAKAIREALERDGERTPRAHGSIPRATTHDDFTPTPQAAARHQGARCSVRDIIGYMTVLRCVSHLRPSRRLYGNERVFAWDVAFCGALDQDGTEESWGEWATAHGDGCDAFARDGFRAGAEFLAAARRRRD